MQNIFDRLDILMQTRGLLAPMWERYQTLESRRDPIVAVMRKLEYLCNAFQKSAVREKFLDGDELTDADLSELELLATIMAQVESELDAAWRILHEADKGQSAPPSHALRVLDGLQSSCQNPEQWNAAVKRMKAGEVRCPWSSFRKIDALFGRYVTLWERLDTDGLKGASHEILREMEVLRLAIVAIVAESGDIEFMVCCAPGTDFYLKIKALATQSCSSRDIQTLEGWWKSVAKPKKE
jgi:hypothetical protein